MGTISLSAALSALQDVHAAWSERNFGKQPAYRCLLGVMEEVGELAHAHLKAEQGIRTTEVDDVQRKKMDAVGDIILYLVDYCTREGIVFSDAVLVTAAEVHSRDWIKHPKTGRKETEPCDGTAG